jgi:DNA-binding MarR family transcriptional regulator
VKREKHESDRRAILIRLTAKGHQTLGKILPDYFTRVSKLMSGLKSEERRSLSDFMERILMRIDDFSQN